MISSLTSRAEFHQTTIAFNNRLGGNEQATHKYVSELLGKETIDTNTYGQSYGMRGKQEHEEAQLHHIM